MRSTVSRTSILAVIAVLAGTTSPPARADDVVVAAELAVTGPYAFAGAPSRDALPLAIDQINRNKLAGDNRIKLILEDTGSDKQQAISLINRFAQRDNALIVIGPSTSLEGVATAPVANALKIPMLTTTALSGDITKAGPYAFKTPESPEDTVVDVTRYAVEKMKVNKVALVFGRDNEGQIGQKNVARDYFKVHGVKVVDEESILSSDSDFQSLVTKLSSLDIDAIFLTPTAEQAANIVFQAREGGLDPKVGIIGTSNMGSDRFLRVGGKAVEGAVFFADYFAVNNNPTNKAFVDAYQAKFHKVPDNTTALGYATMQVMAAAIKAAGPRPTRETVRAALADLKHVPVVLGRGDFSFDANRNPHYGQVILTVRDGKFVPAP